MPSQLTRSVFRRLLLNEPLVFRCPTRSALRSAPQYGLLRTSARRTIFGFSRKTERAPRPADLAPGLSKMLDLNSMVMMNARPPPPAELAKAWIQYFKYKQKAREGFNDLQAGHVLRTFKHLQMINRSEDGFGLPTGVLRTALEITSLWPDRNQEQHAALARVLFQELDERKFVSRDALKHYTMVLINTGHTTDAINWLEQMPTSSYGISSENLAKTTIELWKLVMKGYAKEGNETGLLNVLDKLEAAGITWDITMHEIMIIFYATRNDISSTKKWYESCPTEGNSKISVEVLSTILGFCIRNNELDWSKNVFRPIMDSNPSKAVWDVLFLWVAGGLRKGVEDVNRMMDVMIQQNFENEELRPDAETINGLVEYAMSLQNSYLAERYIALGNKYGIQPNARTFILQLDYRISAGDFPGARAAYDALQSEEVEDKSDLPAINRYIRALCASSISQYDQVVSIYSELDERKVHLEPSTVSAISLSYLSRGELNDVLDILQTNTFHYTVPERAAVMDTFVKYCLDETTNTPDAWAAYNVCRSIFQEMPVGIRTKMMKEFFARERSDMACHVFGHMRQHDRRAIRPVLETYIDCFRGIARCKDKESLDMVHNMFKLDSSIEPNTKLYNSLMMAYTQCEDADRALNFWQDITNSREGPSYESLELVFNACQEQSFGDRTAKDVWEKMQRMEIDVTREVFVAYVCALAGQGLLEDAQEMVDNGGKDLGLKPDVLTIGSFYNALPGQNRKDLVEIWAKDHHPAIWADLEKLGQSTMQEGHRIFNMDNLVKT